MAVAWPADLPQSFLDEGYAEQPGDNVLRETMDVGPPKSRRRASAAMVAVSAAFMMTAAQKASFEGFRKNTLFSGTIAFQLDDPGGVQREYFVRAVQYLQGPDVVPYWRVQLQLEYLD